MYYTHTDSLTNSTSLALHDGEVITFFTDESPLHEEYLAWVAEGNTAEEWSPNGDQ
jgi:hypothetical protein